MSGFAQALAKYKSQADKARGRTVITLAPVIGVNFSLGTWGNRAQAAYAEQWLQRHPDAGWDWAEVFKRYNDPDRLEMVIWGPEERLSGIGLAVTTGQAVNVRFIEGDPRPECPLVGRRIPIFLECAANYAQLRGKVELRIQPVNDTLAALYTEVYDFTLETPAHGAAYYKRTV
jgi:hypothetical protein